MNENEQILVETGATAGEMLRMARTTGRRKREIQTVAKQLCIREEFLQALEDCNYTFIPELVYVLGFARNYAIELGLDPDEIVAKIKSEMGVVPEGVSAAPGEIIQDVSKNKEKDLKDFSQSIMEFVKKCWHFVLKYWIWFVSGLIVIVGGIVLCVMLMNNNTSGDATVEPVVQEVVSEESDEPVYNIPVRERFGVENKDKAEIILQAIEDSAYVSIEDSRGRAVFGRTMLAGDVYFVPKGKYKAKFGNAGGIDVWVNGELAPKVGANHVAKSGIILTPENLMLKK